MTHKSHRQSVRDIHKLVAEQATAKASKAVAMLLRTPQGTSALAAAAGLAIAYRLDDRALGERLLAAGASVGARGPDNARSALELAVHDLNDWWFDLLMPAADATARIDALIEAIHTADLDWLTRVLDALSGTSIDGVGQAGLTPLHAAALAGNVIVYDMVAARAGDRAPTLPAPTALPADAIDLPIAVPAETRPAELVDSVLRALREQRAPAARLSLLETMAAHLA